MQAFQHLVLRATPRASEPLARHLLARADPIERAGGALFGVFTPQIGLSSNHVVALIRWPEGRPAAADTILHEVPVASVVTDELWTSTSRPAPGDSITETTGVFSHRWFDTNEADWPRFLELSESAWGNFESVHDTRVIGFWRSQVPPAPGQVRVWLMAWYRDLASWDHSRYWNPAPVAAAAEANQRFRERRQITNDSAVSIMGRIA